MGAVQTEKIKNSRTFEKIRQAAEGLSTTKEENKFEKYKAYIGKLVRVSANDIEFSDNVRASIDEDSSNFKSLVSSIRRHGIQQNIVVDLKNTANGLKLICVSGHRRVTAAKIIDPNMSISCLLKSFQKNDERVEIALSENLLREDLHCLDVADGYARLIKFGWTKERLMEVFGKTQRTIGSYLKMAAWPQEAKNLIRGKPKVFTARLLIHQLACRKFQSEQEITDAVKKFSLPKENSAIKPNKKEKNQKLFQEYIAKQNFDQPTLKIISKVLKDLKFID